MVAFGAPNSGNSRLLAYATEALEDSALMSNPPLHADVLLWKLDLTYVNSYQDQRHSQHASDWDALTSRPSGLDVVSLDVQHRQ